MDNVMKLSPHFSRHEFACKCGCGFDTVDYEIINLAELIRTHIGPFTPTSACRCEAHNKEVGGSDNSQHLIGRAMDVPAYDPKNLYDWLCELFPNHFGFGLYNNFVHVDTRTDGPARWQG